MNPFAVVALYAGLGYIVLNHIHNTHQRRALAWNRSGKIANDWIRKIQENQKTMGK